MRVPRRTAVLVAGVALFATACGGPASPPGASAPPPPGRGVWTDDLRATAVRAVADTFAADNGITVDVQVISSDMQAAFITANTAGNGPDVVVGAHDWIGNMVQNGAVDPLQIAPEQLADYSDVAISATTYDGQLYGLPYGVEALTLYRNTAVVPDAPATLEDAFSAGQAAVDAGQVEVPFSLAQGEQGDAYYLEPLYTSMGGFIFGETADGAPDPTQLGIGGPGSIAAAQRISELGEAGSGILTRSVDANNSVALFADGRAAFLVSGPWALPTLEAGEVEFALSPIPGFAGQAPAEPFTGVQAFFVASRGANKAFAQEFVTSGVNNPDAMRTLFDNAQRPPALLSLQESVAAQDPRYASFIAAAEAGRPMPSIPQMSAVFGPLGQAYAAIIGGADPAATMQGAGQTIAATIAG